jgi:hypothetical protein
MPKTHPDDQVRYEVIVQEDPETGDLLLPIPQPILTSLGWKEGDDVDFDIREDGTFLIKKVNK